jgi:hypothetical protein
MKRPRIPCPYPDAGHVTEMIHRLLILLLTTLLLVGCGRAPELPRLPSDG